MAEKPVPSALQSAIGSAQAEYAAQNPLAAPGVETPAPGGNPLAGVVPPTPAPLPPSALSSLSTNPGVSGGFNTQLAANQDKLAAMQPNANAPGAWARNIVGAVQKTFADKAGGVVDAVTTGLAGAGNVGTVPEGSGKLGGAFYGIGKALQGVQAQQNAQQEAKDRKQAAMSDQEYKHALALKENMDMFHQQQTAHLLSQASQDKMVSTGKQFVDMVTDGPDGAPILAENIPYSQIQSKLAQNHLDATQAHFQPTSQIQVGERKNLETGDMEPVFETRYTVLGNRPNPLTPVNADFAKRWNAVFPDEKISDGTSLPYETLSAKEQQIANYETAETARNKQLGEFELSKEQEERAVDSIPFIRSSEWQNALAHAGGDQHKALAAIESQGSDSPILKAYPNVHNLVVDYNGGQKQWDEQTKSLETQRHDLADEQEKQVADNLKAMGTHKDDAQGDITLTGDAYGKTLQAANPGEYAEARQIGNGQMPISNLAYLARAKPRLLEEVALLYPDLKGEKLLSLVSQNKEFTSGKAGNALNAANSSYQHLAELYRDTTASALLGGPAAAKRDADMETAVGEYARFLNFGNSPSKEQLATARAALDPPTGLTSVAGVGNLAGSIASGQSIHPLDTKLAALREISNLLDEKKMEYRTQWQSGMPSAAFNYAMPGEDATADQSSAFIRNGGKMSPPLPQAQSGYVSVQIPGYEPRQIPLNQLTSFRATHANATIGQYQGTPVATGSQAPETPAAPAAPAAQ